MPFLYEILFLMFIDDNLFLCSSSHMFFDLTYLTCNYLSFCFCVSITWHYYICNIIYEEDNVLCTHLQLILFCSVLFNYTPSHLYCLSLSTSRSQLILCHPEASPGINRNVECNAVSDALYCQRINNWIYIAFLHYSRYVVIIFLILHFNYLLLK